MKQPQKTPSSTKSINNRSQSEANYNDINDIRSVESAKIQFRSKILSQLLGHEDKLADSPGNKSQKSEIYKNSEKWRLSLDAK